MVRRKHNIVRFSRDYRRPPKWGMGLPPRHRRRRFADPRFYLSMVIIAAAVGLIALPGLADATLAILRPVSADSRSCRIYQVIDGDTVRMWCPGRGNTSARLIGFDTPELFSPACPSELLAATKAKWALRMLIWRSDKITLVRQGRDRYGRALVAVFLDGEALAHRMITSGYARPYSGGKRQGWCA